MTALSYQQRIDTLRKLRSALVEQRDAFYSYLIILEGQEQAIMESDTEELERSIELEHTILKDIVRVQRVIDPLAALYRGVGDNEAQEVDALQDSLSRLKGQVLRHNFENRRLLAQHVEQLREELQRLKLPDPVIDLSA